MATIGPNVLRNPESGKLMLVDFEQSRILKPVPILQETSSNLKRKSIHQGVSCYSRLGSNASNSIPHIDSVFILARSCCSYVQIQQIALECSSLSTAWQADLIV